MSKKIHTVQFSNKDDFDQQVNIFLEFGGELIDGSYQIIQSDDGEVFSQVIKYENCELEFFENGKISSIRREIEKDKILEIKWDKFGKKFSEGIITKEEFYPNGVLNEKDLFIEKKQYWLLTFWYENGQKKEEGISKDNKIYESVTKWYENGQKRKEDFVDNTDGIRNGTRKGWYENGQIEFEQTFNNGHMMVSKTWDKNGKLTFDYWNQTIY